jgi:hypothetical protein
MVNTFVTHSDFSKTAKSLDSRRLFKQIIEAHTILRILQTYEIVGKFFKLKTPHSYPPSDDNSKESSNFFKRISCTQEIQKVYSPKNNKTLIWESNNSNKRIYKLIDTKSISEYDKSQIISMPRGYVNHPITKMWLCYDDSLKHYINCCITEWTSRKKKNGEYNKTKYELFDIDIKDIKHPWWISHSYFLSVFRCSLYRKELEREEPEWYITKFSSCIYSKFYDYGYIWLSSLSEEQILRLMNRLSCKPENICAPITSDKR